jgi:hypothetical protein
LSLLLYGLDTAAAEVHASMVAGLREFRRAHPQTDMVLCSRREDYDLLSEQLGIRGALLL